MEKRVEGLKNRYSRYFTVLYEGCGADCLQSIRDVVAPSAADITERFFEEIAKEEGVTDFLAHEGGTDHLKKALGEWLRGLFVERSAEEIAAFVERQLYIGNVHARINVSVYLVSHGFRIIKGEISARLERSAISREDLAAAINVMNHFLDLVSSVMNESFFNDLMFHERQTQALQHHVLSQDLAIKCERLRADMFEWLCKTLNILNSKADITIENLPSFRHSEISLWIVHKAGLYYPESKEVPALREQMSRVDAHLADAVGARSRGEKGGFISSLQKVEDAVTQISWQLSSLVEHTLSVDKSRDALTRLYNRRYLEPVLRNETRISLSQGTPYAVLLIDLDHFKLVNDRYGHAAGDIVLGETAEILMTSVRAGDFVFRYGGEEFLAVLTDLNTQDAARVANKLLSAISTHDFNIGNGNPLNVTASIGVAMHDGHPDYSTVISRADNALYRAKNEGRNRVNMAS